jgi:hypothetical protein
MNLRWHDCLEQHPIGRGAFFNWGRCPQTPGIYRIPARMAVPFGAAGAAPPRCRALPHSGPGSALRSHPCGALSSAQVKPV